MGFYLRKSVRVGPFRFNLSQGGVGISAGIKGFRVGAGPRGNYVHMGLGGIYYRSTMPQFSNEGNFDSSSNERHRDTELPSNTHAPLINIESVDTSKIVDSSSRELLEEMKIKQAKMRFMPLSLALSIAILLFALHSQSPTWSLELLLSLCFGASYYVHIRDSVAKTVVLFYEFDEHMERAYSVLHAAAQDMASASAAWHIEARGKVYNGKYHAGAGSIVRRKLTRITRSSPPNLKTNIETISIGVGKQTLHFFPDRVLIYEAGSVGSVGYRDLHVGVVVTKFIEEGTVPPDSTVVGQTWRFVNKNGGPDRRFSNNRQLPICLYDEVSMKSSSGLNELLQISNVGTGSAFARSILQLSRVMPAELTKFKL